MRSSRVKSTGMFGSNAIYHRPHRRQKWVSWTVSHINGMTLSIKVTSGHVMGSDLVCCFRRWSSIFTSKSVQWRFLLRLFYGSSGLWIESMIYRTVLLVFSSFNAEILLPFFSEFIYENKDQCNEKARSFSIRKSVRWFIDSFVIDILFLLDRSPRGSLHWDENTRRPFLFPFELFASSWASEW